MGTTLLDLLVESGLLNSEQYEEAMRNCLLSGGNMSTSLLEIGLIEEDVLARFLSRRLGIPFFDPLPMADIPADVLNLVTPEVAVKYRALPLGLDRQTLSLAMADPSDQATVDDLASLIGTTIQPLAAPEIRLLQALKSHYQCSVSERDQGMIDRYGELEASSLTVLTDVSMAEEDLEEVEILEDFEEEEESLTDFRLSETALALSEARDRQEIAAILFAHLRREWEVLALFLVRNHEVSGWKAVCRGVDIVAFDLFSVPLSRPSVLKTVVETRRPFTGAIEETPLNSQMLESMGNAVGDSVLLLPLLLEDRVINILYLEGEPEVLRERMTDLARLQEMSSLAFQILLCKSRLLRF
ncbi:MAG: hypothetical protein R2940_12955 [Syntrophotaleaceae bacterium]